MKKQNGFAKVNGTCLYYEIAGSGDPLVLLHGFTGNTQWWDNQFEIFSTHYQVIRYDTRGFGNSALPTRESYSHVDDLKALLENLGISRTHVLGLSMGGEIAIDFALVYPELTTALITVGSALGGFPWSEKWRESWTEVRRTLGSMYREGRLQDAIEFWLNHPLFKPAMEKPNMKFRMVQITADYSGWHFLNEDPVCELEPSALQRLEEINVPTLIIVGERDLLEFHAIADTLQQHILNARKVVLPGVGHISNMEAPDEFNKVILSFLAGI